MAWDNRLREIKKIIYALKRAFGLSVTLYQPDATNIDYEKGSLVRSWTTTSINRAIILPYKEQRKFEYDLAYLKSAVNFTYGGYYDIKKRTIIIDKNDLTTIITLNDYISFDDKRWEVLDVNMAEHNQAYVLSVVQIDSADAPGV
jgi:hypothetical protein